MKKISRRRRKPVGRSDHHEFTTSQGSIAAKSARRMRAVRFAGPYWRLVAAADSSATITRTAKCS